ncbi:unnamed protein product [Clavelina lepadiformis]|uniref:Uncharacterized protein n=1 Tax=Clavelina lepadiformis TaxID=159417 RepID=A0ABP0F497_CLALP
MLLAKVVLFYHVVSWFRCAQHVSAVGPYTSVPVGAILSESNKQAYALLKQMSRRHNANVTGLAVATGRAKKPRVQFQAFLLPTEANNSFLMGQAFCDHASHRTQSIIGFSDVTTARTMISFSEAFQIPWISPSFSTVSLSSPYLISIYPNLERPLLSLAKKFKWPRFTLLYDSAELHLPLTGAFEFSLTAKIPIQARSLEAKKNILSTLKDMACNDERHIIIDLGRTRALEVLNALHKMDMLSAEYHYVFTDPSLTIGNLSRYAYEGSILTFLSLVDPVSKSELSQYDRGLYPSMTDDEDSQPDPYEWENALVCDAFKAMALGMKQLAQTDDSFLLEVQNEKALSFVTCDNQSPPVPLSTGINVSNAIKKVSLNGVTGKVAFDDSGRRINYTVGVFSLGPTGMRHTGQWTDQNGEGLGVLELSESIHDHDEPKKEIKDRILIVTTIIEEPYVSYKKNWEQFEGNDRFEGFCVDLLRAINTIAPFKYIIKPVDDGQYGSKNEANGKWNGMIGEVKYQKADMAVAPLTITSAREAVVDFTKPFMTLGISVMIKKPEKSMPHIFSFLEPLSNDIWLCILLSYVGVSVMLHFVTRLGSFLSKSDGDVDSLDDFGIMNSFWFSLGSFVQQGADISPKSFSGRLVSGAWWFFTLIIISSYTANLAAFLTVDRMVSPISGADDLAKQNSIKYGTLKSGSTVNFFKQSPLPTYKKMWAFMNSQTPSVFVKSNKDGIERVRNSGGKYAFLMESSLNEYMEHRKPCNTLKVGPNIDSKGYGIALAKESRYYDTINLAILTLREQGKLQKMKNYWWYDKSECGPSEQAAPTKTPALAMNNVAGVFYILYAGLVLAMFCAVVEFLYKARSIRKKRDKEKKVKKAMPESLSLAGNEDQGENLCSKTIFHLPQDDDNRLMFN